MTTQSMLPTWTLLFTATLTAPLFGAESLDGLRERLTFHASFDRTSDADHAAGDARAYTGSDLERKDARPGLPSMVSLAPGEGRWGGALRFADVGQQVVFYRGQENVPYAPEGFDLTVSFWMRLDPQRDLKPGYVDPLQITDKEWNNAALFVDFTKDDVPRHFRLGVFSDYAHWNPQNRPWDAIPVAERPMVVSERPPFSSQRWTHVVMTLEGINGPNECTSRLYLDGQLQGQRKARERLTWDPARLAIMLGIQYIGAIDDFSVFRGAITEPQVGALMRLEGGIAALRP